MKQNITLIGQHEGRTKSANSMTLEMMKRLRHSRRLLIIERWEENECLSIWLDVWWRLAGLGPFRDFDQTFAILLLFLVRWPSMLNEQFEKEGKNNKTNNRKFITFRAFCQIVDWIEKCTTLFSILIGCHFGKRLVRDSSVSFCFFALPQCVRHSTRRGIVHHRTAIPDRPWQRHRL